MTASRPGAPASTTADKVIRNTLVSYGGYAWRVLTGFFVVACILRKVGAADYGVYVLVETVVTCLAFLDVAGIEGSFVKFIAEHHARGDRERFNQVVNLGFTYYFLFQLLVCAAVLVFQRPLFSLFRLPAGAAQDVRFLLWGFLGIAFVRGCLRVYRSVLLGLLRLDLANGIDMAVTLPSVGSTVLFLSLGWGIRGLVLSGLLTAVLTAGAQVIAARRIAPWLRLRPFGVSREVFRAAFLYSVHVQVARMSELVNAHVDKMLLGALLKARSEVLVGYYELGAKPARSLRDLPSQLLPAILPAASQLDASADRESLRKLYVRGTKYLALLTLPLTFFAVAHAKLLIRLWLGPGFEPVASAFQALTIGYMVYVLVGMGRLIARGVGAPDLEMRSSVLITVLNIALSALFIVLWGFEGALYGSAMSAVAGSGFFLYLFHRHLGEPFWATIARPIFPAPLAACTAGVLACRTAAPLLAEGIALEAGRGPLFAHLALQALLFLGVYAGGLWAADYLDRYDREVFGRGVRVAGKLLPARARGS